MVVAVNEAWSGSEALLHFRDYDLLDVKKKMKPLKNFEVEDVCHPALFRSKNVSRE